MAEESTSFSGIIRNIKYYGIRSDRKWNMGWMPDTLDYWPQDPIYGKYGHNQLTFAMLSQSLFPAMRLSMANVCERKLQKEGYERRAQVGGGRPGPGLSSLIATPILNRLTHLSTAERLYAESCRTDFSSLCVNLLPRLFIEKYLIRILCSDWSILIFPRAQKSDDETINVSTDRKRISIFRCGD
jgi:hypothetical protein